jgi:hypothetical protein
MVLEPVGTNQKRRVVGAEIASFVTVLDGVLERIARLDCFIERDGVRRDLGFETCNGFTVDASLPDVVRVTHVSRSLSRFAG